MKHYTEATDGSYIEHKESALVWHHQEADPDFGSWQAKELLDHLENVLANEPVAVKRGQHIVEVNPQVIKMMMSHILYFSFLFTTRDLEISHETHLSHRIESQTMLADNSAHFTLPCLLAIGNWGT